MIIELQNFGPIKSFKFDTSKDMHAIFGKNNIGKSYAISAVYLILKGLKTFSRTRAVQYLCGWWSRRATHPGDLLSENGR